MITDDEQASATAQAAAEAPAPKAAEGTGLATAPAAATGQAAASVSIVKELPGETVAAKIDALHTKHFAGTELTTLTPLWNKVLAFKEEVKALIAEMVGDIEKL